MLFGISTATAWNASAASEAEEAATATSTQSAAGEPSSSSSDSDAYCERDAAAQAGCAISDIETCYCSEKFAEDQEACYNRDACSAYLPALSSAHSSTCASYTAATTGVYIWVTNASILSTTSAAAATESTADTTITTNTSTEAAATSRTAAAPALNHMDGFAVAGAAIIGGLAAL